MTLARNDGTKELERFRKVVVINNGVIEAMEWRHSSTRNEPIDVDRVLVAWLKAGSGDYTRTHFDIAFMRSRGFIAIIDGVEIEAANG